MGFDFNNVRQRLKAFDFTPLFLEELGWDNCQQSFTVTADARQFRLTALAKKCGLVAYSCVPVDGDDQIPDRAVRLKIDREVTQTTYEHLLVFPDPKRSTQVWQWVRREPGKPIACREHKYHTSRPGEHLMQKLQHLAVSLDEEERGLALPEIAGRVRAAFDVERVTKRFYDQFRKEKDAFTKLIDGIPVPEDRRWYASVMLNRLMFVYFIQRKGFLDNDPNYLRNRLNRCQQERGKDQFYTFYRHFLLRLFQEGLGQRPPRKAGLDKLLGRIPYLNGGIFDIHTLETEQRYGPKIEIPDEAFERVFDYFDRYDWTLDSTRRPRRPDDKEEINPEILGFIFEKYINQKEMGAYYTQEDITEYISKSTIIPFLFDAARSRCEVAFDNPNGPTVWSLLHANPDRYIYPAVRHGTENPLPPEIAAGLVDTNNPDLTGRRKSWNKQAPPEYALATETWREVVSRRQHYWRVWSRLSGREANPDWVANPPTAPELRTAPFIIHNSSFIINDFVTLNLDLRQFAQDVIETSEGPDLLMAFWQAIAGNANSPGITILDPTGGSGAFIFAALNVLEPLYEACLDRMEAFLAEWGDQGKKTHPNYHKAFAEVLDRVAIHPNRRYFILKSIVVNNLYAVDIMEEAVEICKIRLFLALAAQVEPKQDDPNLGIEPLPDVDFNIRSGNTLVGYATAEEVRRCMKAEKTTGADQMRLGVAGEKDAYAEFEDEMLKVDAAFRSFRQQQTELGGTVTLEDKRELQKRLAALETKLSGYLARDYRIETSDKAAYARWVSTHRAFHWLVEFYAIIHNGGFDVIVGNPPYVEYSKVTDYKVQNYATKGCANLYAFTLERSLALSRTNGRIGMIIPISVACSGAMDPLRETLAQTSRSLWLSHYSNRPGQLFTGAQNRLTILLASTKEPKPTALSTRYHRWDAKNGERQSLFPTLRYQKLTQHDSMFRGLLAKVGSPEASAMLRKIRSHRTVEFFTPPQGRHKIFWVRVPGYFCQFLLEPPMAHPESGGPPRVRGEVNEIGFDDKLNQRAAHAIFNSSTYYQFFCVYTDTRHINPSDVTEFPLDLAAFSPKTKAALADLSTKLAHCSTAHTTQWRKSGLLIDSIDSKPCKSILDEIDSVLARHYGFTPEELDFILNYDIKYRLGHDTDTEEA